ncbi:hypothetical protein AAK899_11040 [Erysipelotrichaceae bacterium 51-3]
MSKQALGFAVLSVVLFLSPLPVYGNEVAIHTDNGDVRSKSIQKNIGPSELNVKESLNVDSIVKSNTEGGYSFQNLFWADEQLLFANFIEEIDNSDPLDRSNETQTILYNDDHEIISLDLSKQNLTNQQLLNKLNSMNLTSSLRSLNISGNQLTGTLDISVFPNLWFLDCSDNQLSNIVFSSPQTPNPPHPYGLDCSGNKILWLSAGLLANPDDWADTKYMLIEHRGYQWAESLPTVSNDFSNQSVILSVDTDQDTFDFHDAVPGMMLSNFTLSGVSQSKLLNCDFYSGDKAFTYSECLIYNSQATVPISGTLNVTRSGNHSTNTSNNNPDLSKPITGQNPNQPLLPIEIVDPLDPSVPGTVTDLQQNAGSANAYRLYNPNSGEHFYTEDLVERDFLINIGWKDEGVGWIAPKLSTVPVYRLYNKNAGDHHYTVSIDERDELKRLGWKDEGIGWYSDEGKSVPLFRQYNPNAKAGSHNYTPDQYENDFLVKVGWRPEGIAWYGLPGSERR